MHRIFLNPSNQISIISNILLSFEFHQIKKLSVKASLIFLFSAKLENPMYYFLTGKRPYRSFIDFNLLQFIIALFLSYSCIITVFYPCISLLYTYMSLYNDIKQVEWFLMKKKSQLVYVFIISQSYRRILLCVLVGSNFSAFEILKSLGFYILVNVPLKQKTQLVMITVYEILIMVTNDVINNDFIRH